ncbi:hypothetical protein SKZ59_15120 [Janthinobacterium sp. GMG2]|uniref:hypothetical protein n=1 Tax=Janthinobacterium sp. GMG2 TaxID=3096606 RepID=UPI0029F51FBB|nr:hypothetical protein [Janthinobacterium sp. GMG2]MDX8123112.1 hypothetical protein [Janthinobacterium sp. GMG2]
MNLRELSLPAPSSSIEFERLCLALYQDVWDDHNAQLNGVSGQSQFGVDFFGRYSGTGELYGVQCKVRAGASSRVALSEIEREVKRAEEFEPRLKHFIFATTARRDGHLQTRVRLLSERRLAQGEFSVHVVAWEDLLLMLDRHPKVAQHFFPFFRLDAQSAKHALMTEQFAPKEFREESVGTLSRRLQHVMALFKAGQRYDFLSVSRVAEILGAERITDVSNFFGGLSEPPITFMRTFAERFGVNPEWLIHGEQEVFFCPEPVALSPLDALQFLESTSPEFIFIVGSQSEYGECTIVVGLDEWKYITINGVWHVSSHVGASGLSQLVDLYDLFVRMLEMKMPCRGLLIEPDVFDQLINGEIYPGSLLTRHIGHGDWWVALLDVDQNSSDAQFYGQWYGPSFLAAQRVLRDCLGPQLRNNRWNKSG